MTVDCALGIEDDDAGDAIVLIKNLAILIEDLLFTKEGFDVGFMTDASKRFYVFVIKGKRG